MNPVQISADIVGLELEPVVQDWSSKDTILYALGVGTTPEKELDYLYEGRGPLVLPTFGVIPALKALESGFIGAVDVNPFMILHGEQALTLHRPIPANTKVTSTGRITECWDKTKAAVIATEVVTSDDDGPICTNVITVFVRGSGDFGGDRGPSTSGIDAPPDRAPDFTYTDTTLPQQAALYRLSGDFNPLHIDPGVAQMAGFDKPFIHGLCTFGFAGRALLHTVCGGDPAKLTGFKARFADQVYPGDNIITKIWKTADGEAMVQAETPNGNVVLSQAKATYKS